MLYLKAKYPADMLLFQKIMCCNSKDDSYFLFVLYYDKYRNLNFYYKTSLEYFSNPFYMKLQNL